MTAQINPEYDYPAWICSACGAKNGRWPTGHVASWHPDTCGWCGREGVSCTEPRDYHWPKWESRAVMTDRIAHLEATLQAIATFAPEVTHGWAEQVRAMAREALS